MSKIKKIIKNISSLFIGQIVASLTMIFFSIYLARQLGDIGFGKFSFAIALVTYFSVFLDLGYNTLLIRDVARDKTQSSRYLKNVLMIRILLSLVIYVLIVATINFMGYPSDTKSIVYILSVYTIVLSFSDVFKVTFRAFQKNTYEVTVTISSTLLKVMVGLLFLYLGYGLVTIALIFFYSSIFDFVFCIYLYKKKMIKTTSKLEPNFFKNTIKIALPLGMLSVFAIIYIRTDTILLEIFKGDAVVGWYNAAYTFVTGLKPFPQLFMTVLLPLMSFYHIFSKDTLKIIFEKSFKYLLIIGLPISAGMSLLADKIILLFFGQQFQNAIIALQILSWDCLLIFLYGCLAFVLVSMDRQNQMAIFAGSAALINVVLNLLLIPNFSYVGSAVATITAESFLLLSYLYLTSKYLHKIPILKIVVKPLVACIGMSFVIFQLREIRMSLFLLIAIGAFIYFSLFILMKGFSRDDIDLFKDIIKREKNKD